MAFYVLSLQLAQRFLPKKKTLAIRIFDSDNDNVYAKARNLPLFDSSLYVAHLLYQFDDIDLIKYPIEDEEDAMFFEGYKIFDEKIATNIILDFRLAFKPDYDVMVHCFQGYGRAPAIASALDKIFNLKNEETYKDFNQHVYQTMLGVGRALL